MGLALLDWGSSYNAAAQANAALNAMQPGVQPVMGAMPAPVYNQDSLSLSPYGQLPASPYGQQLPQAQLPLSPYGQQPQAQVPVSPYGPAQQTPYAPMQQAPYAPMQQAPYAPVQQAPSPYVQAQLPMSPYGQQQPYAQMPVSPYGQQLSQMPAIANAPVISPNDPGYQSLMQLQQQLAMLQQQLVQLTQQVQQQQAYAQQPYAQPPYAQQPYQQAPYQQPLPQQPYYQPAPQPSYQQPLVPQQPIYQQSVAPASVGRLQGTSSKNGLTLPATYGKATTFWNGNEAYKGKRDSGNMSTGAWGDPLHPTQYFAALPVGLNGGASAWHNQKLLITNPTTGKQVVVLVQDKGPGPRTGAKIDLSPVAKEALGVNFMANLNVQIAFAPDNAPVGPVA